MSLTLQTLPRGTDYAPREVSSGNQQRSATGSNLQGIAYKGDHWAVDVTIAALDATACGPGLIADLTRGKTEGVVMLWPERLPVQTYGTPLISSAALGSIVPIKGLPAGRIIAKGKFLNITGGGRRRLYQVATAATANGSGVASVTLTQMLRYPASVNDVVELAAPVIEGLVSPGQGWTTGLMPALGLSFSVEERD